MRRYNSFSALLHAFSSRDFYRDVAHSWTGIGLLHLLFLLILVNAPLMARLHYAANQFFTDEWPHVVQNVPEIRLHGGQVSADVPQPYIMYDDAKPPKATFALDTTGKLNSFEDTTARVLVTKTHVMMRDSHQERRLALTDVRDFMVNREKLLAWGALTARLLGPVGFVILVTLELIWGLFAIAVLALFGALVAGSASTLSTSGLLRLASVARTPHLVLGGICTFFNLSIPHGWKLSLAMPFFYMLFAVNAANETPAKPFDAQPPTSEPTSSEPQSQPDCFTPPAA